MTVLLQRSAEAHTRSKLVQHEGDGSAGIAFETGLRLLRLLLLTVVLNEPWLLFETIAGIPRATWPRGQTGCPKAPSCPSSTRAGTSLILYDSRGFEGGLFLQVSNSRHDSCLRAGGVQESSIPRASQSCGQIASTRNSKDKTSQVETPQTECLEPSLAARLRS